VIGDSMNELGIIWLGVIFLALGALLVIASRNPKRNSLTRMLFTVMTSLQIPGLMKDETLVLMQGVGLCIFGLALITRWLFL